MSELKASTDQSTVSKEAPHLSGSRGGCEIKIFWGEAEEEITDAPSNKVSLMTIQLKGLDDL